ESLTHHAYMMNPPTQRDFIFYGLLLASFYLNYYGLIPKFYFTRRYLILLLINTGCFIVINLLSGHLIPPRSPAAFFPLTPGSPQLTVPRHPGPPPTFSMDVTQHLFVYLVVLFLALLLKIRERLKQTEKEKLLTELSYLKAQINPHFLFNILNGIYSLTIERSDKAPDAVIKLSEMMRYVLDESGNELVTLEQELKYIRNYIDLQQSRFGSTIRLHHHIDEPPPLGARSSPPTAQKIAPLILIPFIENAFKHGVNPEEDSDIYIGITIPGDELHLKVTNKKVHIRHSEKHSGLGIANAKKRLQLLYPREHTLRIEDNKEDFRVFVTLKLKT
ncbi:MAG TPA: sensor histidine kinase, partial [Puia sp.]|nr:sensor histidine kinase [Puia sp.]